MQEITLKQLLEAGCHFGHKADRWHPKAKRFIYQVREGIHIIDLAKTKAGLDAAVKFVFETAKNGGIVLFVGTKRQAASVIKEQATRVGAPYISQRWIGGFLTNWEQVHKNLEKIRRMSEDQQKGVWKKYPKHEQMKMARYLARLNYFYGGVASLMQPPNAMVVVDVKRENIAVQEAKKMNIPLIGIVDTNSDPTDIDYPIPANDDAVGSVRLLIETLATAYKEGKQVFEKQNAEKLESAEKAQKETAKKDIKTEVETAGKTGKKQNEAISSQAASGTKEIKSEQEGANKTEKVKKEPEINLDEKPKQRVRSKKAAS